MSEAKPLHKFNIKITSRISEENLQKFLSDPLNDTLQSVPGIGTKTELRFHENGIMCTTQLIGTFLTFKRPEYTTQQHMDEFYSFLRNMKIGALSAGIALCIAEKANTMIPGIFDAHEIDFTAVSAPEED